MASASDNFDRADGAIGANWAEDAGNWDIASSVCVQRTTASAFYKARYTATPPDTNDYYSEAAVVSPTGSNQGTGLCVRASAAANTYYGYFYYGGDNAYLSEIAAGVESILDTGAAVTAATTYVARLEANGTALTGTRDGGADVSATDGSLASGGWGLGAFSGIAAGVTMSWNNWAAADLGGAATGFMTTNTGYWGP